MTLQEVTLRNFRGAMSDESEYFCSYFGWGDFSGRAVDKAFLLLLEDESLFEKDDYSRSNS